MSNCIFWPFYKASMQCTWFVECFVLYTLKFKFALTLILALFCKLKRIKMHFYKCSISRWHNLVTIHLGCKNRIANFQPTFKFEGWIKAPLFAFLISRYILRLGQAAQKQQRPRCPNRKMFLEIRRADESLFRHFLYFSKTFL